MSASINRYLILVVLAALILGACNYPGAATPTQEGAGAIYTAAAETVQAQLTQVSQPPATSAATADSGGLPTNTPPATLAPSDTPAPSATAQPTATTRPTNTPVPCDLVKFVSDVTYPDNTQVDPNEVFVKTWRLQNAGSCTWTSGYALVFSGGDHMSGPASVPINGTIDPGETVDVSVTLTAPAAAGTYKGNWMLRNSSNVLFGLGDGSKPFWVQVKVSVKTGLLYDFLVRADDAKWVSTVDGDPGSEISFGGADDDPNGVAKIKDAVKLETGASSGKVLLTFPRHDSDGVLSGLYPAYTVQSGDHLRARLGFMIPSGDACGNGKVKFQITYKEGDSLKLLKEWTKTCNGSFVNVDIDLSSLSGKTVQFGLVVFAEGSFEDDWAIWNSPRIEQ